LLAGATILASVAKDEVEAVKWYRKAAEQNNAHAQNNLATAMPVDKAWRKMRGAVSGIQSRRAEYRTGSM